MFSEVLIQELKPLHLLQHPFYQAWMAGSLSQEQLQKYAIQYYPHVKAFPRFVSAVHSLCADDEARRGLAHNLADEEGILGEKPHPELWLQFALALGVSSDDISRAQWNKNAQDLVDCFEKFSKSSYPEGLGALMAYEYQIPEIAKSKIEGLKLHYKIQSKEALSFFQVHEEADVYHSKVLKLALNQLSEEDQSKAKIAATAAGRALWDFLTEAYASA